MMQVFEVKEGVGSIGNASDLFKKIKKVNIDFTQENLIVSYLDTKNKVIDSEILFKGGLNSCLVDARTLFRKALLKNSSCVIISHNHPSGNIKPSDEDLDIVRKISEAGRIIGIRLLDGIVFNEHEFFSMEEEGLR